MNLFIASEMVTGKLVVSSEELVCIKTDFVGLNCSDNRKIVWIDVINL